MEKKELWAKRIEECELSELSITKWCEENEVKKNTFDYWKRRLKKEAGEASGNFFELKEPKAKYMVLPIEINICDIKTSVSHHTDIFLLKKFYWCWHHAEYK